MPKYAPKRIRRRTSKLNEYRDLKGDAHLPKLSLNVFDAHTGRFFNFAGSNVSLKDRALRFRGGTFGRFSLEVDWTGIPHNYSNKAQTPYVREGLGLFKAPAHVPITFKKLNTASADTAGVLASDQLIADYQAAYLKPTGLSTQSGIGRVALEYSGFDWIKFGIAYDRYRKEGLKSTFGPIGDRPPRTLNIQFTEPVSHHTNDLTLSGEHVGKRFQAQFSYTFSHFDNSIDTLLWENIYTTAAPDSTYDVWDRSVSVYGRRPLGPDNRYHNASVSAGLDLPADSRLNATFSYGQLDQNEDLLPYSYNSNVLVNPVLPRPTADAQIQTRQLILDYVINPMPKLSVRAWVRHYGLDNNTPQANWQYVTSDTSNLNGTVSYKNKRVNLAFASDRTTAGLDASYRFLKSTCNFGYEREGVQRDFREADTVEDRVTLSWRLRPARWANLRARYVLGRRNGDYNPFVTRQSYWYAATEANHSDNPVFTFSNHPGMVKFDVADRVRHQGEFTVALNARGSFSLSRHIRYRNDDFDSDVRPTQPLSGTGFGETAATTPGDKLGLLKDSRIRYSLDAFYMANDRFSANAFLSLDRGASRQRSLEYNENNKGNPSAINTAELGPWTRKGSQWTSEFDDDLWTVGFGGNAGLIPNRVFLGVTYSVSIGRVASRYSGYGVTNWDGTPFPANHQFAFGSVPDVNQDMHLFDLRLQFPIIRGIALVVGYNYERFLLDDWQQRTTFPWVEPVGSEYLLRDTSRSYQWGNRLFNLGSALAPSYNAHVAFASFHYRF